ncbi:copper resistance-associated p-type ATPase [Niveomyces insectorum RCEF 264]|uniref:Copper resistance-associated P-type ATPase n=1 Tax=Niveomyces insectorum RCEF 264 TaxID=1081102 RepID=A0A167XUN6_9HYPO|nr:copper resistance-associated p-type ATPase [Niveomyces insectorum RCEF 264]
MTPPPLNRASRSLGQQAVTTSFLLSNLHCPSCVSTIREVLQEACTDHIRWVSPNIVTSVVTVEHDPAALLSDMTAALTDAGFDICGVTSSAGETLFDFDAQRPSSQSSGAAGPSIPRPFSSSSSAAAAAAAATASFTGTQTHGVDESGYDDLDAKDTKAKQKAPMPAAPSSSWGFSPLSRWMSAPRLERRGPTNYERAAQAHLNNCEQCRRLQSDGGSPSKANHDASDGAVQPPLTTTTTTTTAASTTVPSGTKIDVRSGGNKPSGAGNAGDCEAAGISEKTFVTVEAEDAPVNRPTWRANLAVGGMTCAVCVNAITDELKKRDWISKVTVNLISNSATVEFDDKNKEADIVETIEDLGYDATVDSIVCIQPRTQQQQQDDEAAEGRHERTVEILIEGLYCEHCPDRVTSSLAGFRRPSLNVVTKPTPQRPILKLTYVPDAPAFTIRHILAAIEASDSALSASIYHPPTLEERSKIIQAKHQRQILYRVIFTGIVCIPTFIIGIIYMSLLPSHSHGRMFMMEPWTSGISRIQIALFVLATPVYFYSAAIFHVRAFKEIRTLWRRGSRTPILQRFYRFGSMNTLMSLGTTIAYISSVSQMIAAAAYRPAHISDSNFYFDSVVFLTFFLLCGRLIEAYSKSRTGNAVEMLGRLRPNTAILVGVSTTTTTIDSDKEVVEAIESVVDQDAPSATGAAGLPTAPGNTSGGTVIKADLLDYGDVVRVLHGASPPADGVIVHGRSNFDESSLTGESRLVPKVVGDEVFSGTVNKEAPVLVRVTGTSGTSMLDQIVAVVREGQTKRAPMEQIADLLTTYFVPVVTLVAISTWVIWLSLGLTGSIPGHFLDVNSGGWVAFSLQFAIAVFVVACPCGLGLAAPTAIFVAGGMAAKYGILAKGGGEAFEKASRIDCVVFDKTGTLTLGGEPTVTDSAIYPDEDDGEEANENSQRKADLLGALQAVEENSGHPIAKAIVSFCSASNNNSDSTRHRGGRADDLQEVAGRGMRAVYHSADGPQHSFEIIVGNEALMADFSVPVSAPMAARLQQWKSDAKSVALAATRPFVQEADVSAHPQQPWTLAAALSISDPVRPEAAPILAALQARGVLVYMLSGDNATTAAAVARQLGIPADQVIAEVLPTEKATKIQALQASLPGHTTRFGRTAAKKTTAERTSNGSASAAAAAAYPSSSSPSSSPRRRAVVAMVGDGINDSPALTQADVGIAVGSGSDVAISSADFVLVQSNLQAVVTLIELSRAVFRRIAFNFGWALVYNVVAVPIAAGALYPIQTATTKHVRLDPVWASLAMALSSISVVLSSLALRSRIPGLGFRPTVVRVPPPPVGAN